MYLSGLYEKTGFILNPKGSPEVFTTVYWHRSVSTLYNICGKCRGVPGMRKEVQKVFALREIKSQGECLVP